MTTSVLIWMLVLNIFSFQLIWQPLGSKSFKLVILIFLTIISVNVLMIVILLAGKIYQLI